MIDNERVRPVQLEESNNTLFSNEESNTNDHNIVNVNKVTLKVGDLFNNWESVQMVIDSYVKQNGFVANKCHKDLDPIDKSIIRYRVYTCWKSSVHQPRKVEDISLHHNDVSYKTDCPWHVNFYLGK